MTLRDLLPGDRFIHAVDKKRNPEVFQVAGEKCEFNAAAGTSTRKCIDPDGKVVDKQCWLEVLKREWLPAKEVEVPKVGQGKQQDLF